jgi:hypothetical protein
MLRPAEPEPRWSDSTLAFELLVKTREDVQLLLRYFEEDNGDEEVSEEDT